MSENHVISWDDIRAEAGQKASGLITVAELSHGGAVKMPVLIINGAAPGPCLWLNGAIHGDELNGPIAIRSIMHRLDPAELAGSVIATPISNPLALQARQKNTPQDGFDLDMQFPGNPEGTLSQRMAAILFGQIKRRATVLIDFHTLGSYFSALPYTVFKRVPTAEDAVCDQAEALARVFDGSAHCRVDLGGTLSELPGNVAGFLDVQCLQHGIPAFMAEIGTGGLLEREMVAFGERGIAAVLAKLGMMSTAAAAALAESTARTAPEAAALAGMAAGTTPEAAKTAERTAPEAEAPAVAKAGETPAAVNAASGLPERKPTVTSRRFLYANHGGLAIDMAPAGAFLQPGDRICRIVDMFGTVEDVRADQPLYVIANRRNPPVDSGDRIAFVGTVWDEEGSRP